MWKRSKTLKVSKVPVVPDFTASIPGVLATESEDRKHLFNERMAAARKQSKKKIPEEKVEKNVYDFVDEDEKKELSGSEDDVREGKSSQLCGLLALAFAAATAN